LSVISNVVDTELPCERYGTATVDHRKVIQELVHAAASGILMSELPELFEAIQLLINLC